MQPVICGRNQEDSTCVHIPMATPELETSMSCSNTVKPPTVDSSYYGNLHNADKMLRSRVIPIVHCTLRPPYSGNLPTPKYGHPSHTPNKINTTFPLKEDSLDLLV